MKLLHVKTARSIWLVDSNDINPRGIDISFPLSAIAKRYGFQKYPKTLAEADENSASGIVYEQGHFETEAGRYEIDKVSMHNDGLVVNNRQSTDLGELFLEDALSFLAGEFGLTYQHGMVHKKIYTSELIVKTEKDLGTLFSPLDPIQKRVGDLIGHKMGPFWPQRGLTGLLAPRRRSRASPRAPRRCDAHVTAALLQELLRLYARRQYPQTVSALIEMTARPARLRRFAFGAHRGQPIVMKAN